jgi:hypothetical protein
VQNITSSIGSTAGEAHIPYSDGFVPLYRNLVFTQAQEPVGQTWEIHKGQNNIGTVKGTMFSISSPERDMVVQKPMIPLSSGPNPGSVTATITVGL